MNLLFLLARQLPSAWIEFLSRLQWKHPMIRRGLNFAAGRCRHQDGQIARGAGRGLRFNVGPSKLGYILGTDEPRVQNAVQEWLRPGMVMYDVGANVGFYSVVAARLVGAAGKVIAFEPMEANRKMIAHNARLNSFNQITVRPEAIGRQDGEGLFVTGHDLTTGKLASAQNSSAAADRMWTIIRSLDSLARAAEIPSPDFIKIDVEGAEADVVVGARELLRQHRPILLIELHGTNQAVANILQSFQYAGRALGAGGPILESPWNAHILAQPAGDAAELNISEAAADS